MEQAAQGGGWVPIPGDVQKTYRCGTSGHGLEGMVVLGWWLDLMILEVFSNLNDSMICALVCHLLIVDKYTHTSHSGYNDLKHVVQCSGTTVTE